MINTPLPGKLPVYSHPDHNNTITNSSNDTNVSMRLSRVVRIYWAEQVLQPARPSDFHTAIFKHNRTKRFCMQPVLGLSSLYDKQVQTQRRNGREN